MLYNLDYPSGTPVQPRVLIHQFDGAMDAGHAGALAVEQLLMTLPSERFATFDVDSLVDYRARRPTMTFENWSYEHAEVPELVIDLVYDDDGVPMLVLHGTEPDYRWEEFAASIAHIVQSLGVKQVIGMTGMPFATPHTRPTHVHHHGSNRENLPEQPDFFDRMQIPASVGTFLELRLGQRGIESRGLTAAIPHYVARDDFPQGASALLSAIAGVAHLALPVGDLEAAASVTRSEIDAEAAEQGEIAAVVSALETQYDSFSLENPDAAGGFELPSADEIGARLEAFLEANDTDRDGR